MKNLSYKVTLFYIFISEKPISESIMGNCFSLNPKYVFKKREFCAAGKLKTLCYRLPEKRQKYLVSIEKEKQILTLIAIF